MRKMLVIARREYLAAVRTKTFIIGLLMMPLLMGGSALLQWLFKDMRDVKEKRFAVVDRAASPELVKVLQDGLAAYNQSAQVIDPKTQQQLKPRLEVVVVQAEGTEQSAIDLQRFGLSEQARKGDLVGFLEILGPTQGLLEKEVGGNPKIVLRYQSNQAAFMDFAQEAERLINTYLRKQLADQKKLSDSETAELLKPSWMVTKALSTRDDQGAIHDAPDHTRFASLIVPMVLMILMFMVTLMGATPLMQSVVEEKMQRIAEVLLGSVQPFPLMMGKLIGMAGVSLTVSSVYLAGAYWAANYFGFAENLSPGLLAWFVVFQALAALMFGSLFIAIGAACTEMRETQNLLWPVMLLATFPMFLVSQVLRDPNSPMVQGLSFFPFATPSLMIARLASPPGIPWWEPALGVVVVLAATLACVWAAGRIFRIGILMQGKGAKFGEMVQWVFRG